MALEALTAQLPEIKRLWLQGLSAADIAQELGDIKLTSSIKRAIQQMKAGELSVKISLKEISSRSDPSRTFKAQEADRAYSKLKGDYSQELLDKTDEFTKNPKYKNLAQVESEIMTIRQEAIKKGMTEEQVKPLLARLESEKDLLKLASKYGHLAKPLGGSVGKILEKVLGGIGN